MIQNISNLRTDYKLKTLSKKDVLKNPYKQFNLWWNDVLESKIDEPNAMTLSTVDEKNKANARIVLLKGLVENGFVFYTNYESQKGMELQKNPFATILFFWKELQRQVKIRGQVSKISQNESEKYFLSRPLESKVGAWASQQSKKINNRNELEENYKIKAQQFLEKVPMPSHWGGYVLNAEYFEFWQGRTSRLHDRICFEKTENEWKISRLQP